MLPQYTVYYYTSIQGNNPIKEFLDSISEQQQTKLLKIIRYVHLYGLNAILPHVRKLSGTPLWEIRVLGKDNIRTIYAVYTKNSIVLLHAFIKKKQKTPLRDIGTAMKRYEDWKRRYLDK